MVSLVAPHRVIYDVPWNIAADDILLMFDAPSNCPANSHHGNSWLIIAIEFVKDESIPVNVLSY